jgi:hypothetical protein
VTQSSIRKIIKERLVSAPRTDYEDPLHGVIAELISAQSSLNMEPEPLEKPLGDGQFLSERDKWASHAMEHITAAIDIAFKAGGR